MALPNFDYVNQVKRKPMLDVREYGAKGNGVADDTAAVQAALTAAGVVNGTVVFPPGTYLAHSGLTVPDNVTVLGTGGTITTDAYIFLFTPGSHVTIRDLNFSTAVANGGWIVWAAQNSTHVVVEGNRATGNFQALVGFDSTGAAHWQIRNNIVDGARYGVHSNIDASDLLDVQVLGNQFINIAMDGIELNHPHAWLIATITNQTITVDGVAQGYMGHKVQPGNVIDVVESSNPAYNGQWTVTGVGAMTITVAAFPNGASAGGVVLDFDGDYGAKGILIANNYIHAPLWDQGAAGFGIGLAGVRNVVISGNYIRQSREQAIHLEAGTRNVAITGNQIDGIVNADNIAIAMDNCYDISITGNQIKVPTAKWGIFAGDSGYQSSTGAYFTDQFLTITGNSIQGGSVAGVQVGSLQTSMGITVTGNMLRGGAGSGIKINTWGSELVVTGNVATGYSGYGLLFGNPPARTSRIANNVLNGNTLGDVGVTGGAGSVPLGDRTVRTTGTIAAGDTGFVNLFSLGGGCSGTLTVTAYQKGPTGSPVFGEHATYLYALSWNGVAGTAITATPVVPYAPGNVTITGIQHAAGVLQLKVADAGAADGVVITIDAQFAGTVLVQ
ncbi:MAG TPA: right-handed parallel beta-helix repeat-containing protein [Bryobacteraceae bacterium]|nr:right-handed parallel beta-helix repeat-containing protein [Bryobacteraceae bacterium]